MRAPDKPTIRRPAGRPKGPEDSVLRTLRDLNNPTKVLTLIARIVMEREHYIYGRRIGYDIGYDEALDEAQAWFKRRYGDGIRRIKFEAGVDAAGFIVRKTRKPQPIRQPDREKAREMLRCQRTW
jgi:hypothetical protein